MRRIAVLVMLLFLLGQTAYSQEKIEPLTGKVEHTPKWEENKNAFNRYWMEQGENQRIRTEDTFWSGEKFIVKANVNGKKQPTFVNVEIIGTEFSGRLMKTNDGYQGEIFAPAMINRWGQEKPEKLSFRFFAKTDGVQYEDIQQITVDDLEKYWLMHRKE